MIHLDEFDHDHFNELAAIRDNDVVLASVTRRARDRVIERRDDLLTVS